jgi:hypothetical protein
MRNRGIQREAPAVVPAGHVARIGWVERAGAGEPARHAPTHLLLHRGEVLWCERGGLGEVDLPVLAVGEHPVDHPVTLRVPPLLDEEAHNVA